MKHTEISGSWLNRLEPELTPWLQKELSPEGYDGKALPVEHANTINIYVGGFTVNLHLPPMAFPCEDPHGWVEKQFTATCKLKDVEDGVRERLDALYEKHREELSRLRNAAEIFRSKGWDHEPINEGYLSTGFVPDKFFAWDWGVGQVDSESVGAFVKGMEDMFMVSYEPGNTLAFYYDGELAAPVLTTKGAEDACEIMDEFLAALDNKQTDQQSEIMLNKLFI